MLSFINLFTMTTDESSNLSKIFLLEYEDDLEDGNLVEDDLGDTDLEDADFGDDDLDEDDFGDDDFGEDFILLINNIIFSVQKLNQLKNLYKSPSPVKKGCKRDVCQTYFYNFQKILFIFIKSTNMYFFYYLYARKKDPSQSP